MYKLIQSNKINKINKIDVKKMDAKKIIHYPRLDSVLMVEKLIYEHSGAYMKKQLWDKLPKKMMYQTFSVIINYLVYSGKIIVSNTGKIIWVSGMQLDYSNRQVSKEMNNAVGEISRKIIDVLKKAGVKRAGIFGSYARGEQKRSSDVDILIEVEKGRKFSLFDLVGLKMEIESILKRKVDLLTYNGISHFIREKVLKDEVRIM